MNRINDIKIIKDVLAREELINRPDDTIFNLLDKKGVLTSWNGNLWNEQRSFSLKILKRLGFGRLKFENSIHQEISYLISKIDERNQEPVHIKKLLGPSASNIISLMVTGERFDFDHPKRMMLDKIFLPDEPGISGISFVSYYSHFPCLIRAVARIPFLSTSSIFKRFNRLIAYLEEVVNNHEKRLIEKSILKEQNELIVGKQDEESEGEDEENDYIFEYLKKIYKNDGSTDQQDDKLDFLSVNNNTFNRELISLICN